MSIMGVILQMMVMSMDGLGQTHGARNGQCTHACDMGVALSRACSSSAGVDRPEDFEVFWKA
jgi:hypothetical protein